MLSKAKSNSKDFELSAWHLRQFLLVLVKKGDLMSIRLLGVGSCLIVGLLLTGLSAVYLVTSLHLRQSYKLHEVNFRLQTDSATLAHGRHIATIRGCLDCHGADFGGQIFIDDPLIGRYAGPNLTRGGRGAMLSVADWEHAVRHGVRNDGKPLRFMPVVEFNQLSDEDLAALIAYVQHLPAVDRPTIPIRIGPLARLLYLQGNFPLLITARLINHSMAHPFTMTPEPTVAYGAYLAASCSGCHGHGFSGGPIPGTPSEWPPAANLTPDSATGLGSWTEADFFRALREGKRPDSSTINTQYMPILFTSQMTDVEIQALWAFLKTLPSRPKGQR